MNKLYSNCYKGNRCNKFRTCQGCNRIRQAKIADLAEMSARFSNVSQYAVIMPTEQAQAQVKILKSNICRTLTKHTDGAMVTVETSKNDALHLNIIANSNTPLSVGVIDKTLNKISQRADIFMDTLKSATDVRRAIAYSLKIESIPKRERFAGHTYTSLGSVRTIKQIMQSRRMLNSMPIATMVSFNQQLVRIGLTPLDEHLFTSDFIQTHCIQLMNWIDEIDKLGICYSSTHGLMNVRDFSIRFNRKIGVIKASATRKNNNKKWKVLPKGISLSEHLTNPVPQQDR